MTLSASLELAQWLFLAALCLGFLAMTRFWLASVDAGSSRIRPINIGDAAPPVGRTRLRGSRWHLLLFLSNGCERCASALDATTESALPRRAEIIAVFAGEPVGDLSGSTRVEPDAHVAFGDYSIGVTPTAVLVNPRGEVALMAPVGSAAAIEAFLDASDMQIDRLSERSNKETHRAAR